MLTISENILLFVSGFGVLQAFLSAGLLYFHPRSDRSVTTFLALYIACIPAPMLIPVLQKFFSWQEYIFIAPFTLLIGPFLYLYVRSFKEVITWKRALPHFILFFIYFIIIWRVTATMGHLYPRTREDPGQVLTSPFTIIPVTIRMIQLLAYYFASRKVLRSYQHSIRQLFSETSRIDLNWVKLLLNGYLILVVTTIASYSIVLRYPDLYNIFILIVAAIGTPYIYMATLKGVTQPTLWQIQPATNKLQVEKEMHDAEEIEKLAEKIEKPVRAEPLLKERNQEIAANITRLMQNEKLYQETQLTLQNLADRLNLPAYQVSQAINESLNKNFYDLINGYRVSEAKRLLSDPDNSRYTILSIGFEAGFNSKTTFNTVFKKFTGATPTEYRDRQKEPALAT